ncbi:MAG: electron transfer flavoprotein subunit alpha/FixB family protein [Thermoanaerobaculia bacterium]|nr:electron transfer flavoprotein subunit alpha/FixB family protein [Thermoanaerobaculia bacterium]
MANPVLVVLQQREGGLHRMSREAIAAGQSVAETLGGSVEAVLLGEGLDAAVEEVSAFALAKFHVVEHEALASYTPGAYVGALVEVVDAVQPSVVVLPHTYQTVDFLGLLAQRVDAALVPEVTGFESADDGLLWERPVLGGKLTSKVAVRGGASVLVSVQSGSFSADGARSGEAPVERFALSADPEPDRELLGTEEVGGDQVDLSQAGMIVAVGRGIGDGEKMSVAEDLAEALGAELAASRPVIDNGWLPRDRQIGSSGQTVSPKLYVALGISGAIQHLVGMKGSKTVVAINRDPNAPIFSVADYGYVGDLHEFTPAFTTALREAADS